MAKSVSLRLEEEFLDRVDRILDEMKNDPRYAGVPLTRARALVILANRGAIAAEEDYRLRKKSKR
jgi:hypothetical protein